jgi:hypothetical protein
MMIAPLENLNSISMWCKTRGEKTMRKLLPMFLILFFVSCGMVYAQGYSTQSIEGKYALQAIYGDNEGAGIGVVTSLGNGTISATYTINAPAGLGMKRFIAPATAEGTYSVNGNGTMYLAFKLTFENDISFDETADCMIMQADDNNLATELYCVGREPLTPLRGFKRGGIIQFTCKRLPD